MLDGKIGKVTANIPWKNILEESIVIQIDEIEVDLVVQSREDTEDRLDMSSKSENGQ